ncbi:MAG: chromosomal replication initiator protein DnaA [Terriglobales bacterium]
MWYHVFVAVERVTVAGERVQTTFRVDPELLKRFRHALLERERKMTPVIEELIQEWLHGYEFRGDQEVTPKVHEAPQVQRAQPAIAPVVSPVSVPPRSALPGSGAEVPPPPKEKNGNVSAPFSPDVVPIPATDRGQLLRDFDYDGAAQLHPRYTFDNFVIGGGNQFAYAACQAVAERPSKAYNPLFLYGGVGMGKTHLMQAIGHEIKRRQPEAVTCYISAERFTNELINSLRYDKVTSFRDRFRNVHVLLMDDVQFLAQKERTQEEFFHTFNALHESMKQIVIASDRPPKALEEVESRLRSRFEWGLIADIQPPDLETKVAIVQKKAEQEKVNLPADVALYIASNIRSNVRELEGGLIRLIAHSSLIGAEISLPYAQQVLRTFIDSQARKVTIESIQRVVAEQFGLRTVEIKAKDNSRAVVYPRQIAMYLAKHMTEASLPEIGRQFGGKHPTTVLHSIEKIDEIRKTDKDLSRLLDRVTEGLGG